MDELNALRTAINTISLLSDVDWELLSTPERIYIKSSEYFIREGLINKHIGFVTKGMLRLYYIKDGEEINVTFFSENSFIVSYHNFITQTPCRINIQALEDCSVLLLSYLEMERLFQSSHPWERFGRKFSEMIFITSQRRIESFLFETAEQRYELLIKRFPEIHKRVPLYHIASYLGIKGPSLSRIRKRLAKSAPS